MIEKFGPLIIRKPFVPQAEMVVGKTEGGPIVREVDARGNRTEVMYSTNLGRTFITGFFSNAHTYHISSVTNNAGVSAGIRDLPQIFGAMEKDLIGEGVNKLTTSCVVKLVPLAVRRYGFRPDISERNYQRALRSRISARAIPLYKNLDAK